jgi:hypothetical protein
MVRHDPPHARAAGSTDLGGGGLFAEESAAELGVISRHLAPEGTLMLSFQAPEARRTREIQMAFVENLCGYGFRIVETLRADLVPVPAVCIVAEPRSRHSRGVRGLSD